MKLVFGVGVYDSEAPTKRTENGKIVWRCRYYAIWCNMLKRCYHKGTQDRSPTYDGVVVCTEWLTFSSFVKWLKEQPGYQLWLNGESMTLDKDIIEGYSKVYSPTTCALIPQWLNKLLTDSKAIRGELPIGVSPSHKNYRARVSRNGESYYLGTFGSSTLAHAAWQKGKVEVIEQTIVAYKHQAGYDERVIASLGLIAQKIRKDFELGVETTNYDWRVYE